MHSKNCQSEIGPFALCSAPVVVKSEQQKEKKEKKKPEKLGLDTCTGQACDIPSDKSRHSVISPLFPRRSVSICARAESLNGLGSGAAAA